MSDVVSPEVRSRMMAGIKGKNTRPELQIRKLLFAAGYRFRLHRRDLPGTPDIVMPGKPPAATQTAPPMATQTAPPGRGELTH